MSDRYFIAKGKHLVVPVTKQEYEDHWNKKRERRADRRRMVKIIEYKTVCKMVRQFAYALSLS